MKSGHLDADITGKPDARHILTSGREKMLGLHQLITPIFEILVLFYSICLGSLLIKNAKIYLLPYLLFLVGWNGGRGLKLSHHISRSANTDCISLGQSLQRF